jgi:hypothetical protein
MPNNNGKRRVIAPEVAFELRKLQQQIDQGVAENQRLSAELADERKARETLERQEVHIDDMPGKQLPYKYQININLPGGSQAPVTGTVNVSRDGPFIARRLFASVIYTEAPSLEVIGLGTADYTDFIGRFAPISSRVEYFNWARDAAQLAFSTGTPPFDGYVPPPLDFEWQYSDGGSERNRQDKPISGDILFRRDDDGYFMNNEIFAAGTTISFICNPLRAVPILSIGSGEEIDSGPVNLQLKITFDGFKVLQPLEM